MSEKLKNIAHLEKSRQKDVHPWVSEIWKFTSQIALKILESDGIQENIADDIILKLEESREKWRDKIVNVQQTQRNFDVMVVNENGKIDIILKSMDDGLEFDLNSLFPSGWYKFIPSQVDCYFNNSFTVWVNLNNQELRGFILGLLHEIWHTHQKKFSKTQMFIHMMKKMFVYTHLWVFYENITQRIRWTTEIDIIEEAEKSSLNERNAWAYALVQARKLEKMWFNVFDGFQSVQEISNQIGQHLATYDECLFYDMLDTFWDITPENIHELQDALKKRPLFNKKTKNIYQI